MQTDLPEAILADGSYDFAVLNRELDRVMARTFLGKNAAFLGPIMTSLEFIWDEQIGTAATDGTRFWWAPKDFLECTFDERVSTVLHEVYHVARLHMLRRGKRDPKDWNFACDIRINRDLVDDNYTIGATWVQYTKDCPYELEEDIYEWIQKTGAKAPAGGDKLLGDMDPGLNLSPSQMQANINIVIQAVHQATVAGKPGSIPGGLTEIIDKFLTPVIPWEQHVQDWMNDLLDEDYSYARPNRRYSDIYLPHRFQDDGRLEHLIYFLDVSGSVSSSDELRFASELKYVWETFQPQKMTLVQFDTKIQKVIEIEEGNDFKPVEIVGRGGTCLKCVRDYILKHEPTAAIIFTDLYVEPMKPLDKNIPILWAVNRKDAKGPFGKTVYVPPVKE